MVAMKMMMIVRIILIRAVLMMTRLMKNFRKKVCLCDFMLMALFPIRKLKSSGRKNMMYPLHSLRWAKPGRSPLSSRKLWLVIQVPPLCQSTNAPLTCAVSFDAQKKLKNRRGIGKKWRSSSTGRATTRRATGGLRTLYSVNKAQTCMISYELF